MTTAPSPGDAGIPGLDDIPRLPPRARYPRHALGLPAGSVRALLAFMLLAAMWALAWATPRTEMIPVTYVYLQYVMLLVLAHYFGSHGNTIGKHVSRRSPLGLPSGTVRFLLLAGYLGLVGWLLYSRREFEMPPSGSLFLPLILVSGFFAGFVVTKLVQAVSGGQVPYWFQDIQAWVALLGMIGLTVIVMVRVFVNPNIGQELQIPLTSVETGVAAVVGFYFGARS